MTPDQSLALVLDGQSVELGLNSSEPLVRAVAVSLFTWRRANPDDALPGTDRLGWWGDTYATISGDRIGSRLWLLCRSTLTERTVQSAREYAQEALAWLVEDGVATSVEVQAERLGLSALALGCRINRADGAPVGMRFSNVWEFLRAI